VNTPLPRNGVTPPLVTPLTAGCQLDEAALENLARRSIDAGCAGVFVLGTTGEGPSVGRAMKRDVIAAAVRGVEGRAPVLAGLIEASTEDARRLAGEAYEAGAAALVWTPPFYFHVPQHEVIAAAERLLPALPLPVYLYNIPVFTKVPLEPETLARLAKLPNVFGIKDSGGDLAKLARTRALLPETPILWGPEEIQLDAMAAGATGGVNGGANLFPTLFVALDRAIAAQQMERARQLQALAKRISDEIYAVAPGGPGFVHGIKCGLDDLGLARPFVFEPLTNLSGAPRARIQSAVASILQAVEDAL